MTRRLSQRTKDAGAALRALIKLRRAILAASPYVRGVLFDETGTTPERFNEMMDALEADLRILRAQAEKQ